MVIDLKNLESIEQLHNIFSKELNFPGWYGMNWDAITGLVIMPATLTLSGWNEFKSKFPEDSRILAEIAEDCNTQVESKKI
jgi:RNAse (barnase) inhibitor barstar